jgi:hypothetical protein
VEKIGLDAVIFIRFIKMCRNMFLVLSFIGCAILIPVNVVTGNVQTFKDNNFNVSGFMKMTPQFMAGQIFWAMVACAWIIDIVVCFFLWHNYRAVARLRREYFESKEYQNSLHSRTLMVTEIPTSLRTEEGILRIVDDVKQNVELPNAVIARNVKELPEMIEEHEENVRKLEEILAKYLKNPAKLPPKRPMIKPSKKDANYKKGEKVDAIDYLTDRIKELEAQIRLVRESVDQRNAMSYGFASYDSIDEAHTIAYAARNKHPHGTNLRLAPRPSDIIWKNLPLTKQQRRARRITNNLWIVLMTLIWIAPNALLAVFISNLSNLGRVWPAFNTELHRDPKAWAIVQGVAAPAITSLFYFLLPSAFRKLSIRAGDLTKTSRDRHVYGKLYSFFVFNNLLVFSLFGALWQFVTVVIQARDSGSNVHDAILKGDFWDKTMIALCSVSPFWITWLLQRNLGAAVDISQVVNLAWGSFSRRFLSPTPRQLIELTAPPSIDYASYYNYFTFYSTVALSFATLQPLVLPVTALYFVLDSYLKKYLIMYVFVTKTESGGQFWRVLFNRIVFATIFSNFVIALLVKAKGITWIPMLLTLLPLPFLMVGFKWYCSKTFDDQMHFYSKGIRNVEAAAAADTRSIRSDRLGVRFGHPALFKPLMTPMVAAKSQHLLAQVYHGRLDDDDVASVAGYSDVYSLSNMKRGGTVTAKKAGLSGFEIVDESKMDFENFKNRADFKSEFGGDGEMYGRPEDLVRSGTPAGVRGAEHARSISRDSERTLREESTDRGVGTVYPAGYHQTPSRGLRGYSPSPDRGVPFSSDRNLLRNAAPMASGTTRMESPERVGTPGSQGSGAGGDYFRGRRF